jgi:acyl-CoA synthetase (AMP-forming)/AMP-acid ligase II
MTNHGMPEVEDTAFGLTVGGLFAKQCAIQADAPAVDDGSLVLTYGEMNGRVNRLANWLQAQEVRRGDRVAILAENRHEYLEIELACAKLGVISACLNWRMSEGELLHCVRLVEPKVLFHSERYLATAEHLLALCPTQVRLGTCYEACLAGAGEIEPEEMADPEDGLLILYTSGTTGLPKGALISQRAMLWRTVLYLSEAGITRDECYVAWSPLCHMAGSDYCLASLLLGGKAVLVDGFDLERLLHVIRTEKIGYLPVVTGMVDRLIAGIKSGGVVPRSIRLIGAMADLVPPDQLAEITELLNAPFMNSFGMTEVGTGPASGSQISVGASQPSLSKRESTFCLVRLVDENGREVGVGVPGEMVARGPSLFSGYWNDVPATTAAFRGGWYHTGDVFVRQQDGSLQFVERLSFMIKSGGENIYPAEIERALLQDTRVAEACVVSKRDPTWGEVPVAFVARRDEGLSEEEAIAICKRALGGYKKPKEVYFVAEEEFPRNAAGKIERRAVRQWLTTPPGQAGGSAGHTDLGLSTTLKQ